MPTLNRREWRADLRKRWQWVLLAALAVVAFSVYGPLYVQLRAAARACIAAEAHVTSVRETIVSYERYAHSAPLVREENLPAAIDEITRRGKELGIHFVAIAPKAPQASLDGSYRALPVELEIESDYQELGSFLGSLDELGQSIVSVDRLIVNYGAPSPALHAQAVLQIALMPEEKR